MSYDYRSRKIVAVLSSELDASTSLRVLGHLGAALGAHTKGEILGRELILDAEGSQHRGIARFPFIILRARPKALAKAVSAARQDPTLLAVDFPREMLETSHDDDLVATLATARELTYLGLVLYGDSERVANVTRKFSLWR